MRRNRAKRKHNNHSFPSQFIRFPPVHALLVSRTLSSVGQRTGPDNVSPFSTLSRRLERVREHTVMKNQTNHLYVVIGSGNLITHSWSRETTQKCIQHSYMFHYHADRLQIAKMLVQKTSFLSAWPGKGDPRSE